MIKTEKLKTINLDNEIHKKAKLKSIKENLTIKRYVEKLIEKDNKSRKDFVNSLKKK